MALGVRQRSAFYWTETFICWTVVEVQAYHTKEPYIRAYTVMELGEMLPVGVATWRQEMWGQQTKTGDIWVCCFEYLNVRFTDIREADARAKMLVHLIKEGIIPPPT